MSRSSVQLTVSLPPELYKKAMKVARMEIRSKSDLVREALRQYISGKEDFLSARKSLANALDAKGIRTLDDIEKMIDAGRT